MQPPPPCPPYDNCGPSMPSARLQNECRVPVRRFCPPAPCAPGAPPGAYSRRYVGEEAPIGSAMIGASQQDEAADAEPANDGFGIVSQNPEWDQPGGFDLEDGCNHINRRFLIEFRFSMLEAAQNPAAVTWNVNSSMYSIFQRRKHGSKPGDKERTGDLSRAMLVDGNVIEVVSDAPTSVNVQIDGMRGNAYTSAGKRTPIWITPGTHKIHTTPVKIFVPDESIKSLTVRDFSATCIEDVREQLVHMKNGFTFTPCTSPVIVVIQHNADRLGFRIEDQPVIDHQYYKIETPIVTRCLETLDQRVFQQIPFCNLSCFSVRLERSDGLAWDDPTNVECMAENDEIASYLRLKKNYVAIGLQLTYVICDKNVSKTGRPAEEGAAEEEA